jgi:hypothetical protein
VNPRPDELRFGSYNCDNGRPDPRVNLELDRLLDLLDVLVCCEATGLHVDRRDSHRLIRDRSTTSRENQFAFVRRDLDYEPGGWLDHSGTWPRPKYPHLGNHEPRSFPWFTVEGLVVVGVQLPPDNAHPRGPLQMESIRRLVALNPDVALGDFNARRGEDGPGPDLLAARIGGRTIGRRIDCAVVRQGLKVSDIDYPMRLGRVQLLSDHRRASTFTVTHRTKETR